MQQPNTSLPLIPIGETTDLLKAKPIVEMLRTHGFEAVEVSIAKALTKCASAMNIKMVPAAISIISQDIIDHYRHDSIEDVIECLRKGRRGVFAMDRDAKTYGKLNMEVIAFWMSKHLDKKYEEKEKALSGKKPIEDDPNFDAVKFYKEGKEFFDAQNKREKKTSVGLHIPTKEEKRRQYQSILPELNKDELKSMLKGAKNADDHDLVELCDKELKRRKT